MSMHHYTFHRYTIPFLGLSRLALLSGRVEVGGVKSRYFTMSMHHFTFHRYTISLFGLSRLALLIGRVEIGGVKEPVILLWVCTITPLHLSLLHYSIPRVESPRFAHRPG
ncbi:MAG: hypothetical protein GYB31_11830 [Bacteroidetes bacterium]|nr:hypothetical protein [Bacteroidota bacterium]